MRLIEFLIYCERYEKIRSTVRFIVDTNKNENKCQNSTIRCRLRRKILTWLELQQKP